MRRDETSAEERRSEIMCLLARATRAALMFALVLSHAKACCDRRLRAGNARWFDDVRKCWHSACI